MTVRNHDIEDTARRVLYAEADKLGEEVAKKQRAIVAEAKAEFGGRLDSYQERLETLEMRANSPGNTTVRHKSLFGEVFANENYKAVAAGSLRDSGEIHLGGGLDVMLKTFTSTQGSPDSPGTGYAVAPVRTDRFYENPRLPLGLLAALPRIPVTGNTLEYPRLVGGSNSPEDSVEAAYQSHEGADKEEREPSVEIKTAPIATIAAWTRASRQVLDDVPVMQQNLVTMLAEVRVGFAVFSPTALLNVDVS